MTCPNCGGDGPHFVPPSLGERGFYICDKPVTDADLACGIVSHEPAPTLLERADAHVIRFPSHDLVAKLAARIRSLQIHVDNLGACYESVQASGRALRDQINALPYCPFCGQGHAMHTAGCKILGAMLSCAIAEAGAPILAVKP